MEEDNPWLDTKSVKHVNQKTTRPKPAKTTDIPTIPTVSMPAEKRFEVQQLMKKERKDSVNINTIDKSKYVSFLETLVNELDDLPESGKKFVLENFGEDWLKEFLLDIQDVKHNFINSRFFPSQENMILLKYIFLLKQ